MYPPHDIAGANAIMDTCLATTMHATRATVHRSLQISPGALIFQRDMFLDIPLFGDLITLQAHRQHLINESLRRANMKRHSFDYQVGQQVLQLVTDPDKMQERAIGPYEITRVHCNGKWYFDDSSIASHV
jgi:hypothetical protein